MDCILKALWLRSLVLHEQNDYHIVSVFTQREPLTYVR